MRKAFLTIAVLALATIAGAQDKTPKTAYQREGNTFVQQSRRSSSAGAQDTPTDFVWRDSKGNEYPIILHVYVRGEKAGRTTAYVVRVSAKTGKEYKYYLPDGEAIAAEIMSGR